MHTTSRLDLQIPDSTDAVSAYPSDAASTLAILDGSALWISSTFGTRVAANTVKVGTLHYSTDNGVVALSNGSTWITLTSNFSAPPLGTIQLFGASGDPAPDNDGVSRWKVCDGRSLSTSTYAGLFSVIGYTHGGSGGNFSLPDLRGRTAIGSGTGTGLTNRAFGTALGEEAHLQLWQEAGTNGNGQVNAHQHGVNIWSGYTDTNHYHTGTTATDYPDHVHALGGNGTIFSHHANNIGTLAFGANEGFSFIPSSTFGASARHTHTFQTTWQSDTYNNAYHRHPVNGYSDAAGAYLTARNADWAANVMQPSLALSYICRVL